MKKYTQEEFDRLPVENGIKFCQTGDYSDIKRFGKWCSFGDRCSFRESCRFGECCRFGKWCSCEFGEFYHVTSHGGYGSENRTTYFFGMTDGRICVRCGCFAGTIAEWEAKVKERHGDSYLARAYLALIQPVKIVMEGKRNETNLI